MRGLGGTRHSVRQRKVLNEQRWLTWVLLSRSPRFTNPIYQRGVLWAALKTEKFYNTNPFFIFPKTSHATNPFLDSDFTFEFKEQYFCLSLKI